MVDVTQIFEKPQGMADIDPDVAALSASASRVDVVNAMYAEPQLHGSVEVAVTDMTDPRWWTPACRKPSSPLRKRVRRPRLRAAIRSLLTIARFVA